MGKGSKERVVAINTKTVKHIKQYLDFYRSKDNPDTNLLFYTIIKGRAGKMSEGNVERLIQQYADKAREICPDIPLRVHPHMLRRTRTTNLYQNGVELALISRILGHAFLDTTRVYAKPSLAMMCKAMDYVTFHRREMKNHFGLALKRKWPNYVAFGNKLNPRDSGRNSANNKGFIQILKDYIFLRINRVILSLGLLCERALKKPSFIEKTRFSLNPTTGPMLGIFL